MDITNKTKKPMKVPLPAGKRLFLQPGATGQITPKAVDHPPLAKLIEAGDIEIVVQGKSQGSGGGGSGGKGLSSSQNSSGGGTIRHTGDR